MTATDELRKYVKTSCQNIVGGSRCSGMKKILAIADRIDAEYAKAVERARMDGIDATFGNGWVKLPVDADGVPIKLGDIVNEFEVRRLVLIDKDTWDVEDRFGEPFNPSTLHHTVPDSWERIIRDAIAEGFERTDVSAPCEVENDVLVERCRRLAHDGR